MSKVKSLVPSQTTPLTKFILTTEGWLVVASNVALIIVPIVSDAVSGNLALKLAVILNGVSVIARSVLKAIAGLNPIFGPPIDPQGVNVNPAGPDGEQAA